MSLASLFGLAVAATSAAPLPATGNWTIDYRDSVCAAVRAFGEGDARLTLAIRPVPLSDGGQEWILRLPGLAPARDSEGKGTLVLEPSGATIETAYVRWGAGNVRTPMLRLSLTAPPAATLAAAQTWTITTAERPPLVLAPRSVGAALAALDTCQQDLLGGWGVDPGQRSKIAEPARPDGDAGTWVRTSDYPASSADAGRMGLVEVLLGIDARGRISVCRNLRATGDTSLDAVPCRVLPLRGRYRPAIGKDGRPMMSHMVFRFSFRMAS